MTGRPDAAALDDPFAEDDVRPQVALPSSGIPMWVSALMAGTLGLVVLLALNGQPRLRTATVAGSAYAAHAEPALPRSLDRDPGSALGLAAAEAAPVRVPAWDDRSTDAPAFSQPGPFGAAPSPMSDGTPPFSGRGAAGMHAGGSEAPGATTTFPTQPMPGAPVAGGASPGGTMNVGGSAVVYDVNRNGGGVGAADDRGGDITGARASLIRNQSAVVIQGEVLAATLETPVNSLRPGPIRAVIARDVRSFNGARVLIPRGSRLIGEYRADPAPGRRRVLATWTRLIRPDGVAIRIDSPAADAMGGTGLPGKVDTHFLARFLNATLQSALQVGTNLASRAGNQSIIVTNAPQLATGGGAIIPGADDPPTVSVRPGAAVSVFVSRDLDFSGVPGVR